MIRTKFGRYVAMLLALVMTLSINVFAAADTITFIVTGDSIHSEGAHTNYEEWINTSYELTGENTGEIMQNVLSANGYGFDYSVGQWGGYLSSITTPEGDTLGSGTNGSKSGWMVKVNDVMPDVSMDQVYPSGGDIVEIFYIDDYEAEIYGYYSTITVSPDTAELTVYNSDGGVVEPSYGAYSFFNGSYSYSASAEGYVTKTGDFTVSGAGVFLDIVLEKDDAQTDSTTESTTESVNADVEWGLFRKNSSNNGVITADTPIPENAEIKWSAKVKDGWDPLTGIAVANNAIYTATGSTMYKLDKNTGEVLAKASLDSSIGYTYFIAYGGGKVFVQLGKGEIQAFDKDLNNLWTSALPNGETSAQGISPVYYNNGRVYSGTVSTTGNKGYYYCLDADNGEYIWTVEGQKGQYDGFYWSGCVAVDDYIVFGGESGILSLVDSQGNVVDTYKANGDIRSAVAYDNGTLYFTDKLGYIYSVPVSNGSFGDAKFALINENAIASTSTPAIYDGKIYVGAGGKYPNGYFSVFDTDLTQLYTAELEGNVQSSPLVAVNGSDVNVYFTLNNAQGNIMVYNGNDVQKLIDTADYQNYCLYSPVADNEGNIYYQNDSGYIVAIGKSKTEETTAETSTETTTVASTETTTEFTTDLTTETTTQFTTDLTTETTTAASGGGSVDDEFVNVNFTLTGDYTWLYVNNVSMAQNSTVADLIEFVFNANDVSCVGLENNYITSVTYKGTTLSEFDKGQNSGWMYKVNGEYLNVSIRDYKLSDGDNVEFVYVEDYTKLDYNTNDSDWSSSGGGGGSSSNTATTVTTTETTTYTATETTTELTTESVEITSTFDDVNENHWAFDAVTALFEKGAVKGKSENMFVPNDSVTRAEFVAMLYRLVGTEGDYILNFNDVDSDSWYYTPVAWAYENGIVYGVNSDSFAPSANITRQDMACIAERFADKFNVELNQSIEYKAFADESTISNYAKDSVILLYKSGVLKGNDKGEFKPCDYTSRAEAAVIIYNLIK